MSNPVAVFRDDGPLATRLGRLVGGCVAPVMPTLLGVLVSAALAIAGAGLPRGWFLVGAVAVTLLVGIPAGHPHDGRLDWLVPPVTRVTEYCFLAALGLHAGVSRPLVFVLLTACVFHHYDLVYRVRQQIAPPGWLNHAGLGWEGRILLTGLAAATGWLPLAYALLAAYLWLLFVGESVRGWLAASRASTQIVDLEEGA